MTVYKRPINFKTDHLINFCESITDCHHSSPVYIENGKIVIRNFNIKAGRLILSNVSYTDEETFKMRIKREKPEPGDLIITREAPMGEVCIIPKGIECCLGQRMVLIKPNRSKVDNKYLLYSLISEYVQIQINKSNGTGSIVSNLRIPVLKELFIPKREYGEQKIIGKTLSDLDAKIELNNKINAELEAMAKLIYDYWFVQFDFPISKEQSKSMGKPELEGKPYKSSGGKMVWNEELKREIPAGWKNGTIDNIADLVRGVSYSKNDIKSKEDKNVTPILRATNITGSTIDLDNMVYVPNKFVSDNQILNKYDILITMSSGSIDHIGKNGLYYFDEKVAFGAFCAKLVAKQDFSFYLFLYTQSDFMSATIKNECLGTNINNLNSSLVKGFKVIIPDGKYLTLFNQRVESIYSKISLNQKENKKLAELRDWLLPMLMNGQVKVSSQKETLNMAADPKANYGDSKN